MSGSAAAAAATAASSKPAAGQATLVGVSASPAAMEQLAAYSAPADSPPMPGVPQTSSSGSVGATLVGASALRQPQVDPELERLSSRGVALPPGANWQASYAAHPHSGDATRLLPNEVSGSFA